MDGTISLEVIKRHYADARAEADGSVTFACPVCEAEGRSKRVKVFANGAVACARYAGMTDDNRRHVAPIRERLGLASAPPDFVERFGEYEITAEAAGKGKFLITARNGGGLLHTDTFNLGVAGKREAFARALPETIRDAAAKALMRLWERLRAADQAADSSRLETRRVASAELPDGRYIEIIAGGRFAVFDQATGETSYAADVTCDGVRYVPRPVVAGVLCADGVEEYGDEAALDDRVEAFIARYVDLTPLDVRVAARYVRLSYVADRLREIPYLRFIGGRGSGKSRALTTIGGLCYRAVVAVSPTAAVLFRLCDEYRPTLVLDEMNLPQGSEDAAAVFQILNTGFQQGALVYRCEKEGDDFRLRGFNPYGAKLIAGLQLSESQAFESRCFVIEMSPTKREDIRFRLPGAVETEQATLRRMLTLWRLRNLSRAMDDALDAVENELRFNGRIEPRYVQIAAPIFALISDETSRLELAKGLETRTQSDLEVKSLSLEGELVKVIHEMLFTKNAEGELVLRQTDDCSEPIDGAPVDALTLEAIAEAVNDGAAENRRCDVRWLGRKLHAMGFRTGKILLRSSPHREKRALVFDREILLRRFSEFSLPLPPQFLVTNVTKTCKYMSPNDLTWLHQNSAATSKISSCHQVKLHRDSNLEQVVTLVTRNLEGNGGGDEKDGHGASVVTSKISSCHQVKLHRDSNLEQVVTLVTRNWGGKGGGDEKDGHGAVENSATGGGLVALDTETEPFDPARGVTAGNARMVGLALFDGRRADYVTDAADWSAALPGGDKIVVMHNAKFDLGVLERAGLPSPARWEDTCIAAFLLDENSPIGLKELAKTKLGVEKPLTFEEADRLKLFDPEIFVEYALNDSRYTWELWKRFEPELEAQELRRVYELEKALVPVVRRMETRGMRVDLRKFSALRDAVDKDMAQIQSEIFEMCGRRLDLHSPDKVAKFLYDALGLPSTKATRGGKRATDREALESLRGRHPVVDALLRWRELDKLAASFIHVLPRRADDGGRIHPEWNQLGAKTGRFSCANPNVQQIPARSDLGRRIREAFVPDDGNALVAGDYSQMELRILAHYSRDERMLDAFARGDDLHARTAALLFGKTEVSKDERATAKMVNFGIVYGVTAQGLWRNLKAAYPDVTEQECAGYIERYYATFPGVRAFLDETRRALQRDKFVTNWYGRRRRFSYIDGRSIRQAQNFVIQGTAADMAKSAMTRIAGRLPVGADIIAQIHDEILVECRREDADAVRQIVKEEMERTPEGFRAAMTATVGVGETWLEAKSD